MKLFADIYLDEDVSALVAVLLRARGFDALTARDDHRLGYPDSEQLARACELGRCFVTHNRVHFEELQRDYLAAGKGHSGIIIATRRTPQEITRRLILVLDAVAADEFCDQLLYA
jgi:hypothetical protein